MRKNINNKALNKIIKESINKVLTEDVTLSDLEDFVNKLEDALSSLWNVTDKCLNQEVLNYANNTYKQLKTIIRDANLVLLANKQS